VELEGHTESGRPPLRPDYGDWEISSDRANAVRRKLLEHGVASRQVRKVAGYGATVPMPNVDLSSEINRRVTVLLNIKGANL
jgi:chemotaxis protein MotB